MTRRQPRNLAGSVRDRLLNLARERREDFQSILTRYAVERLLYRLSVSKHRDQFLLKGAMLFFVKIYPREAVVAEKFQIMVALGIANSRMKDFSDIWTLARTFPFDGKTLDEAIAATFERRHTVLPTTPSLALTSEFSEDRAKQAQWKVSKEQKFFDTLRDVFVGAKVEGETLLV
jgi:hypothetical protein